MCHICYMSKTQTEDKWLTIRILREQNNEIEKLVNKTNDFLSVPEFIRVAINRELKRQGGKI